MLLQVCLREVHVAVEQGSPLYQQASAALTQLACDVAILSENCKAAVSSSEAVQHSAAPVEHNQKDECRKRITEQAGASSPLEVSIKGLKLRIDDSEASCDSLRYDSSSAVLCMRRAALSIIFKVRHSQTSKKVPPALADFVSSPWLMSASGALSTSIGASLQVCVSFIRPQPA